MAIEITLEPNFSKEDHAFVLQGLLDHAALEIGMPVERFRDKPFAFVVRIDGSIRAALQGDIRYKSAMMDLLWVDESLRKQGIGRSLLARAEEFAKTKGCTTAYLNTLSPANISFYQNSGYLLEFSRANFLSDFAMHYFRKQLE